LCDTWHVSEQPGAEPQWIGQAERVYTNAMKVSGGPFDVMLIFGLLQPGPGAPAGQQSQVAEIARVSMSWAHLKSMIPLLARMVADYESKVGEVPAPGFEDNWKG
jgi:hypothetical protein